MLIAHFVSLAQLPNDMSVRDLIPIDSIQWPLHIQLASNLEHVGGQKRLNLCFQKDGQNHCLRAVSEKEFALFLSWDHVDWIEECGRKAESCKRSEHCSLRILCLGGIKTMNILALTLICFSVPTPRNKVS